MDRKEEDWEMPLVEYLSPLNSLSESSLLSGVSPSGSRNFFASEIQETEERWRRWIDAVDR